MARLGRVRILLRNVFYVSYLLPMEVVAPNVPASLHLAVLGRDLVFISIVVLQNTMVGLGPFPVPHLTYDQVNLRTYVKDPQTGRQAVYFLRSGVTSRLVSLAASTMSIPWEKIRCDIAVSVGWWERTVSFRASGHWKDDFLIEGETTPDLSVSIPPFIDGATAADYLIRPLIGFTGASRHLRRFTITHPDIRPIPGRLNHIVFPMMLSLGLADEGRLYKPESVLCLQKADFSIYLPPVRVGTDGR